MHAPQSDDEGAVAFVLDHWRETAGANSRGPHRTRAARAAVAALLADGWSVGDLCEAATCAARIGGTLPRMPEQFFGDAARLVDWLSGGEDDPGLATWGQTDPHPNRLSGDAYGAATRQQSGKRMFSDPCDPTGDGDGDPVATAPVRRAGTRLADGTYLVDRRAQIEASRNKREALERLDTFGMFGRLTPQEAAPAAPPPPPPKVERLDTSWMDAEVSLEEKKAFLAAKTQAESVLEPAQKPKATRKKKRKATTK